MLSSINNKKITSVKYHVLYLYLYLWLIWSIDSKYMINYTKSYSILITYQSY